METPFLIPFNKAFARVADVARRSIVRFSKHPCEMVELEYQGGDLHTLFIERINMIRERLKHYSLGFCLLDADMIATPSVDRIWENKPIGFFPMFSEHGNQPGNEKLTSQVKIKTDFTYLWFTPSMWPSRSEWFATLCLNSMEPNVIGDEAAMNLIMWRSGWTHRMKHLMVRSMKPEDKMTGLFYHGEKDAKIAESILNRL